MKHRFYQTITVVGDVPAVQGGAGPSDVFRLALLSGDEVQVYVSDTTSFDVVTNLDGLGQDRVPEPASPRGAQETDGQYNVRKYLAKEEMVCVQGIYSLHGDQTRFDAKRVILMRSDGNRYGWENTHWWLTQTITMSNQWLDCLFKDKRVFTVNDFSQFYRTNLDLLGGPTDDNVQECATLSRFLYGLSSAYLLTGIERFYSAARAAAQYLCDTFRSPSHDQSYCFWKFGRRARIHSSEDIVPSQNRDDWQSYALYEQIYAISGLAQYYRISQDKTVLKYICRTISAFQDFYHDAKREDDPCFTGKGGYFSHIDYVTLRPDAPALRRGGGYDNRMKKNWNSIGDHIPAYLINLLLSIDPPPDDSPEWTDLRRLCRAILEECVENILTHCVGCTYPDRPDGSKYVMERFTADWQPDPDWGWQRNRAIVGHNLKIAWNLTRCGHYYKYLERVFQDEQYASEAEKYRVLAQRCFQKATALGEQMAEVGVDQIRGGIFDAVERVPKNGMPTDFSWGNTKDFWQQEQAILAYLILQSIDYKSVNAFPKLARLCCAFWNLFFLDRDNRKIRFRTTESGEPVIDAVYGQQAGHAIAGYHAFELNYLAHVYMRTYVSKVGSRDDNFVLFFRPDTAGGMRNINVLPDFMQPGEVEIHKVKINGFESGNFKKDIYQIPLRDVPPGGVLEVEFRPSRRPDAESVSAIEGQRPHAMQVPVS
ncbi:MAG: hypothetical protein JO069_12320 [Verrucomicrobia bacterium]|nr:hypothetical protein [Verrucomicrobiota bacterium]